MHWANLMLSAVVHRHMKIGGQIDVFKMVHKVMKNVGKIDVFNSGPESDENWWENSCFQQWSRK